MLAIPLAELWIRHPGDNVPWDCGEHPALGHKHIDMSRNLNSHHVPPLPSGTQSLTLQLDSAVLISRRRNRDTPELVKTFSILSLIGHMQKSSVHLPYGVEVCHVKTSSTKYGHVATQSCATAVPASTRHRHRHIVVFSKAADINVVSGRYQSGAQHERSTAEIQDC